MHNCQPEGVIMEKETYMSGFEPAEYLELQFLDSIFLQMQASVEAHGGDPAFLSRKPTNGYSPSSTQI